MNVSNVSDPKQESQEKKEKPKGKSYRGPHHSPDKMLNKDRQQEKASKLFK